MTQSTVKTKRLRGQQINQVQTPEYGIWKGMRHRCQSPKHRLFPYYGARGIVVCQRWDESFINFLADMGRRPTSQHSIERVDNSKGYEPDNCVWADKKTQLRNTRQNVRVTYRGETRCLSEWCELLGLSRARVDSRLRKGWIAERAFNEPKTPPQMNFGGKRWQGKREREGGRAQEQ